MQRQFKQYPCSKWAFMTIVNDGLFSRGLAQEVFKLSYGIYS